MQDHIVSIDKEAIIREWEKTHRPSKRKSCLNRFDTLIREKIEAGYTQQSVAELLCTLGCSTTHQNLSRYLKKHMPNRNITRQESGTSTSSSKSGFGTLKEQIRDQSS